MSGKKRILHVDDDRNFLEATARVLESAGYETASATGMRGCFERIAEKTPDLIILDVMMGRIDTGFELTRKLKNDPKTADIPVVLLTGLDKKYPFEFGETVRFGDWLKADRFLEKPLDAAELLEHIEELLGED